MDKKTLRLLPLFCLLLFGTAAQAQSPGDVITAEIMQNPSAVNDSDGEWVEVFNTTDTDINLDGWTLKDDDSQGHTIDGSVVVPAGGFTVLCRNQDASANGGFDCDYEATFGLTNGSDEVVLQAPDGTEIDRVAYDGGTNWPDPTGASMVFTGSPDDDNNAPGNWTTAGERGATYSGSSGDLGSPGTNGQQQNLATEPALQFTASGETTSESDGAVTLTVSLRNPDGNEVSVDVAFDDGASSASGADLGGYSSQTVTFPASANNGAMQDVAVDLTNDDEVEGSESAAFHLQNLQSSGAAKIGSPGQFELEIEDDDLPPLVINEIHADPAPEGEGGDANNDGERSSDDDEFVEIVNPENVAVDVSNYTLSDKSSTRYTFPEGTTLDPGEAATVFGGGTPQSIPGFVGTAGSLSLSNSGDAIILADATGSVIQSVAYGGDSAAPAADDQSITRDPAFEGNFKPHTEVSSNDERYSPGRRANGQQALPVELAAFDAAADGRDVVIQWRTASETNNDGFHIERASGAGGAWEQIAFVEGAGTTAEAQRYRHRAEKLAPGQHVFRLKQVDFDGSVSYSAEVEVAVELAEAFSLSAASPNPFNPQTQFTLSVPKKQHVTIAVFDALGRRVQTLYAGALPAHQERTFSFEAGNLPSGLYFVRVTGETFRATRPMTLIK